MMTTICMLLCFGAQLFYSFFLITCRYIINFLTHHGLSNNAALIVQPSAFFIQDVIVFSKMREDETKKLLVFKWRIFQVRDVECAVNVFCHRINVLVMNFMTDCFFSLFLILSFFFLYIFSIICFEKKLKINSYYLSYRYL